MLLTLERLRPDHAEALYAFELTNRAWFTRTIPDRGDTYFAEFPARHAALLAEQAEGISHFHIIRDASGTLIGRINLIDAIDGTAELGYRLAESATGQGYAKAAVAHICHQAATTYALTALTARTTLDNPASIAVLTHNEFKAVEEFTLDDRPALRLHRTLE
ncbi:GNAT family N-acetyltransferase [Streptomyces sp. NRRL WC-3742]|uniref:GNAT family N-acetyltransferase n=1 Tax=Streptomyces sp. NRRL WC-3742 TaxID=1463934 RepID=UPI0004CAC6E2|nr:GNAT family N-acetyltransferase [Streptomyces sp. NRRL WC-3742]